LPGRHHTRPSWSTVWDGAEWVRGEAAVRHILSITGSDPALLPWKDIRAWNKSHRPVKKPSGRVNRATASLADGGPIPAGQRNTTLTSLAGSLRQRGFDADCIAAELFRVNAARCSPALSDGEVLDIARSVARYEPGERGVVLRADHDGITVRVRRT